MAKKGENIYKRKDGRYEGRYIKGYHVNGKPYYGYVYGVKYSEVKNKLQPLKAIYADKRDIVNYSGTLAFWAESWMQGKKQSNIKISTYSYYETMLLVHIVPVLGAKKLCRLTPQDIEEFVLYLQKQPIKSNTMHNIFNMLKRLLQAAVKQKIIPSNPCEAVELPKKDNVTVKALTIAQQQTLEQAAYNNKGGVAVLLALYTGMRIGEICALTWGNVDLQAAQINIQSTLQRVPSLQNNEMYKTMLICEAPKTQGSVRVIPLGEKMVALLTEEKAKATSDFVVGQSDKPIEPRGLRYQYYQICKQAQLTSVNFHALRHTFATRCLEQGVDIAALSRILGHSSIKMTLDVYADATMENKIKAVHRLDNLYADM